MTFSNRFSWKNFYKNTDKTLQNVKNIKKVKKKNLNGHQQNHEKCGELKW